MATPYEVSLNKLKFILDQCAPKKENKDKESAVVNDEFTILKKKIHEDLRGVRKVKYPPHLSLLPPIFFFFLIKKYI